MKKILLIIGLVLLTASQCSGLEFYSNTTTTESITDNTTVNHNTLQVDRSGEPGTKDFIYLSYATIGQIEDSSSSVSCYFQRENITIGEDFENVYAGGRLISGYGLTFNKVTNVSLSNTLHNFTIDFAEGSNSGYNVSCSASSIVLIEKPPNTQYSKITTEVTSTSDTVPTEVLNFTCNTGAQEYIIIWGTDIAYNDESDSYSQWQFLINGTIYQWSNSTVFATSFNDGKYHSQGGVIITTFPSSASRSFVLRTYAAGSDSVSCNNTAIFIIPVSDFNTSSYTDKVEALTEYSTTSFIDTDVNITQTFPETDYFVIGGGLVSNEATSQTGALRLVIPSKNLDMNQTTGKDGDTTTAGSVGYWSSFVPAIINTSGSQTFKLQAKSNRALGADNVVILNDYLAVLEIPTGEAPPPAAAAIFRRPRGISSGILEGVF